MVRSQTQGLFWGQYLQIVISLTLQEVIYYITFALPDGGVSLIILVEGVMV